MSIFTSFAKSSVGKKQIMALTGLALCGFLVSHLLGNFLLLVGPDAFNFYAYKLTSNPLIYVAEAILLVLFLSHVFMAIRLVLENNAARPVKYYAKKATGRGATFASATMPYTGLIILIFLVTHLMHFKYGSMYTTIVDGVEMRDIYKTVVEYFAAPIWVVWYVFAMACVGIHTSHGLWSALQSIGFNHPKYNCTIKCLSKGYGIFVAVGFSALAVYSHFQGA